MDRVLIVGGGVGGMSAAISLGQVGVPVDLVEADPEWRSLGAGLTLNGATMVAFQRLGVLDAVRAQGFGAAGTGRSYDADGNLVHDTNREESFGPGMPVAGGILRPALHTILQDAVRRSAAQVRLGIGLADLQQTADKVEVTFTDATKGAYDLVIGADGLFSKTRSLIFPEAAPKFTGQGCWRALVARPADLDTAMVFQGPRHKVGFNPVSSDQMYMYLLQHVPDNPWVPQETWVETLKELMSDFGGPVVAIREALGEHSSINYRPLESILLPPPWYKGRVLLIGDAAHATTPHVGYGAGLAIEDGVVLGELLGQGLPVIEALPKFMDRRYERCRAVVHGSLAIGELEMKHAPAAEQRQAFIDLMQTVRTPM